MIINAVASGALQMNVYDTLSVDGPKHVGGVFTGTQIQVLGGVKRMVAFGRQIFDAPGEKNAMTALAGLLGEGRYKPQNRIQRVGSGFEAIAKGLKILKGGVSGTKLVVTV